MKAVSGSLPSGEGWATELKWDGMRLHVQILNGVISLRSASGRDVTQGFPELAELATAVHADVVLDGEAVVFSDGDPSFARLQHRIHVDRPTSALLETHPVVFVAFDLLWLNGLDATPLPYLDRRRLLAEVLTEDPRWKCPPHSLDDPSYLFQLAQTRQLEGVICKRTNSPYRPGRRSDDWVKVKVRQTAEFVVGATIAGSGSLDGQIGSLAVGVFDEKGDFHYAGSVGSGLNDKFRNLLEAQLQRRTDCPFLTMPATQKVVQWVEPTCVVQVGYSRWDPGAQLWHPTFLGIRTDKDPSEVRRE